MNELQAYKLLIAYDGTDFFGWQSQVHGRTIVDCLQRVYREVFGHSVTVIGASRTDTGVHAAGQVAKITIPPFTSAASMLRAWNARLPSSIVIRSLQEVPLKFHPQKNVQQKVYYYHLFTQRPLPFFVRLGWYYEYVHQVDWHKFSEALTFFQGEHDFAAFVRKRDKESTIRTVHSVHLERVPQLRALRVVVKGPGFLHHQIRRMVGAALDVARKPELKVSVIKELLDNPGQEKPFLRAEGCGLILRKIIYK